MSAVSSLSFINRAKAIDLPGINGGCGAALRAGVVQRRFGAFPLRLERRCALSQKIVQLDDAVFDRSVEPLQAIFGIAELPLQVE
jgi:hypothetical protein